MSTVRKDGVKSPFCCTHRSIYILSRCGASYSRRIISCSHR